MERMDVGRRADGGRRNHCNTGAFASLHVRPAISEIVTNSRRCRNLGACRLQSDRGQSTDHEPARSPFLYLRRLAFEAAGFLAAGAELKPCTSALSASSVSRKGSLVKLFATPSNDSEAPVSARTGVSNSNATSSVVGSDKASTTRFPSAFNTVPRSFGSFAPFI